MKKGLIEVYTGEGKGKTTAALGLVLRATAHKLKVCYIYFRKNPENWFNGEHLILKKLGIMTIGFAKKNKTSHAEKEERKDEDMTKTRQECLKALNYIRDVYKQKQFDLIILDEILICLRDGFIDEEELIELLRCKPEEVEIVLTGRGATKKIIEISDLVSEIRKIKHPYDTAIKRRAGIEY